MKDTGIITGGIHRDARGSVAYVNDFDFKGVKRFYAVTHSDTKIFRGWHGHKHETKHLLVTRGSFLVAWVIVDDWEHPSESLVVNKEILRADEPVVLRVQAGTAVGFKALEMDSTLMVFSDLTLDEAKRDDIRFGEDYWKI